ncbi:MAG: signal recognition particle-docking protein FtsY [Candidatus Pacearchaeota archaeon]
MFKALKEKLKSLFRKKEKEIEEEEKKELKEEEKIGEEKAKLEKKEKYEGEGKGKGEGTELIKKGLFDFRIRIDEKRFDEFFTDLKLVLLQNNVAYEAVNFIESKLRSEVINKETTRKQFEQFMNEKLRAVIKELFVKPFSLVDFVKELKKRAEGPAVIVFFGINGSGKTTSIAKIAWLLKQNGLKCVLAASDTFRAASIEQLEKHGEKLGVKVIKHKYGSDPAAVAFDAINYARAHGIDAVLIDTSGRMHTEKNLMEEMKKICRVAKPHLRLFVGESIVGNDAIEQGKAFNDAVGIDGIILTKADVDEKGGAALSISYITKKPILYLGVGQAYSDLEPFDVDKILERIF